MAIRTRSNKWLGWRPDLPDNRDHLLRLDDLPNAGIDLPTKHMLPVDLMPAIRDQGPQGSCTGHMAAGMASYLHLWSGQKAYVHAAKLSPRFAYWNARVFDGTTGEDSGAYIRDAIKGLVKFGIATEKLCKYNSRIYRNAPGATAFKNAEKEVVTGYRRIPDGDLPTVKTAIAADLPVGFGFSCYENMDCDLLYEQGELPMPSGWLQGGHAVWACGYDDNKIVAGQRGGLLIANSWGTDWGIQPEGYQERGYFWMPYAYVSDRYLADDFWVTHKIT